MTRGVVADAMTNNSCSNARKQVSKHASQHNRRFGFTMWGSGPSHFVKLGIEALDEASGRGQWMCIGGTMVSACLGAPLDCDEG